MSASDLHADTTKPGWSLAMQRAYLSLPDDPARNVLSADILALRRQMLDDPMTLLTLRNTDKLYHTSSVPHLRAAGFEEHPVNSGLSAQEVGVAAETHTTALIVLKAGRIQAEYYFDLARASDRFAGFSISKTIVALLVGIALDRGIIHSLDDAVGSYVPELAGTPAAEIRLRNLLTMRSGLDHSERMDFASPSPAAIVWEKCIVRSSVGFADFLPKIRKIDEQGASFAYSSMNIAALGIVLERAVEASLSDFMATALWQPLGAECDGHWMLDGPPSVGREVAALGFSATLRDFARLGLLLLNGGRVTDQQIVSSSWIDAMTRFMPLKKDEGHPCAGWSGFGFCLWRAQSKGDWLAFGFLGQYIAVNPITQVVAVKLSRFPLVDADALNTRAVAFLAHLTGRDW